MMIVTIHATVAYYAMAAARSSNREALGAEGGAVEKFQEFDEVDVFVDDVAGVGGY